MVESYADSLLNVVGKFTFVGLEPGCILTHPDYAVLTHRTVIEQVGPLLKGRNEKYMRKKPNVSQEE